MFYFFFFFFCGKFHESIVSVVIRTKLFKSWWIYTEYIFIAENVLFVTVSNEDWYTWNSNHQPKWIDNGLKNRRFFSVVTHSFTIQYSNTETAVDFPGRKKNRKWHQCYQIWKRARITNSMPIVNETQIPASQHLHSVHLFTASGYTMYSPNQLSLSRYICSVDFFKVLTSTRALDVCFFCCLCL